MGGSWAGEKSGLLEHPAEMDSSMSQEGSKADGENGYRGATGESWTRL
jgi:hypothetical protein